MTCCCQTKEQRLPKDSVYVVNGEQKNCNECEYIGSIYYIFNKTIVCETCYKLL